MKKTNSTTQANKDLRNRAEKRVPRDIAATPPPKTEAEALALVHELQVHQIELEMQNDELRRSQVELSALEARYRELYDFAPVGYLTLDSNDRILEANLSGAALLGVGRRDLINQCFPTYLSEDSQAAYHVFVQRLQDTSVKQVCDFKLLLTGGKVQYLQAEAMATGAAQGEDRQVRIAILDITERKQFEQVSLESAQQFRKNFENVFDEGPLGIAFVDLNRQFLAVNKQLSKMLGYTTAELASMNVDEVTYPGDVLASQENATKQLSGGYPNMARETRYRRKKGDLFWARTLVTLMRDSLNQPTHFLEITEDITDQKMAEQGRLAAIVQERTRIAQEIHDTLAQGFTGILIQLQAAAYAPEQEQARVHIAMASELARDSLQEARRSVRALRPKALEGGSLSSALGQLVAQVSTRESTNVKYAVHGTLCLLPVEIEDHLYRIGQEAITNAIKHSQANEILLDLWFEPTLVRLCIHDNGKGFDAKAGFQGSGFGLVGMSERAEQIGGLMALAASPGNGTSITITVSTAPAMTEESKP